MTSFKDFQSWLCAHGQSVIVDGVPGPASRAAIPAAFVNTCADAVSDQDIEVLATRLGCTPKQLKAMSIVESGGSAFDNKGRPKILFERHLFYRQTGGKYGTTSYSNKSGGGYREDSWLKLALAASKDVDAAFSSASWGKFQVLGCHWSALGYPSPLEMAYSTVTSEAAHYEMLARYIEHNNLKKALAALSTNPDDNRPLAKGYNGPRYEMFCYHEKLARAMK